MKKADLSVSQRKPTAFVRVTGLLLAGYALAGGVISLLGWVLNVPRLSDWDGNGISIQPNAAVCVIFMGLCIMLLALGKRRAAGFAAVVPLAIGLLTIIGYGSGVSFGIDEALMFGREWGRRGVIYPGRMGPPGTLSWTLLGAAGVIAGLYPKWRRFVPYAAAATALVASLSLVGYSYGADFLYTLPRLTVIAFQTSTFVLAVSVALALNVPEYEPVRTLVAGDAGGKAARETIPVLVVLVLLLGWLRVWGQNAGLFDTAMGTAMLSLILIVVMGTVLWRAAGAVSTHETALRESEAGLRTLNETLEAKVSERTAELAEAYAAYKEEAELRVREEQGRIDLLKRLVSSQEAERERVGRDIHDHLGQRMTAIRLQIESLKEAMRVDPAGATAKSRIETLDGLAEKLDAEVSYLAWELRPTVLDQSGLVETLRLFVQEWSRQFGVEAQFEGFNLDDTVIDKETETHLYRITQEALNNISKHADALNVSVQLARRAGKLSLIIEDNGRGFKGNGKTREPSLGGLGLSGMRERVELIGGEFEIESEKGKGTTIFVRVSEAGHSASTSTGTTVP